MDLQDYYQSHEWDVMSVPAKRSVVYSPLSKEFYPDITFNITLRRKTLFYTMNLIIPCVGISFLTVLTFYLPSESGEKISLCISILLSLTVFVLLLNDLIPPTSLVVPLIGKYLSFTFILVSLSVLLTVVVLNVHFRSPSTHEMPVWTKSLFLYVLPRILLMKRPPITSSIATSNQLRDYAQSFLSEAQKDKRPTDANGKKKDDQLKYIDNLDPRLDTFTLIETGSKTKKNKRLSRKDKSSSTSNSVTKPPAQPSIRKRLVSARKKQATGSNMSLGFDASGNNDRATAAGVNNRPVSKGEIMLLEDKLEAIGALNNIVAHLKEEHRENRVSLI